MALRFSGQASRHRSGETSHPSPPPNYRSRAVQFRLLAVVFAAMTAVVLLDRWIASRDGAGESQSSSRAPLPAGESRSAAPLGKPNSRQDDLSPKDDVDLACQQGWKAVYTSLRDDEKSLLFQAFRNARLSQPLPPSLRMGLSELLASAQAAWDGYVKRARSAVEIDTRDRDDAERRRWLEVIQQADRRWRQSLRPLEAIQEPSPADGGATEISSLERRRLDQIQSWLDEMALDEVRDDTVYRHAEKEIWFRLVDRLQQPSTTQSAPTPTVDYAPLHRQSDAYRGRKVRVRGVTELAYRVPAPTNAFGVREYYVFWLRPQSGASRPIIVYALELPTGFPWSESGASARAQAARPSRRSAAPRAEVSFTGYYFKRLAYRSAKGIATAPLIVSLRPEWRPGEEASPATASSEPSPIVLVAMAAFLAALAVWGIGWKTRKVRRSASAALWLSVVLAAGASPAAQPSPSAKLPWEAGADQPSRSARTFLPEIDDADVNAIGEGEALSDRERSIVYRLLLRIPKIGVGRLERAARDWPLPEDDKQAEASGPQPLDAFRLAGRVLRVEEKSLSREEAERFEFQRYYMVVIAGEGESPPVTVFARVVPSAWKKNVDLDEPASAVALYLKRAVLEGRSTTVFVADRIAWFPTQISPSRGVERDHLLLAKHGFDVGLLDQLPSANGRAIGAGDGECFTRLLAAASRMTAGETSAVARKTVDVPDLLSEPESHHGRLYSLRVKARRITRVLAESEELQHTLGSSHYYQIDGFLPLGDQSIRLADRKPSGESPAFGSADQGDEPIYQGQFPVTVCVTSVADSLLPGDEQSRQLNQMVRADAFFVKLWAYRSRYLEQASPGRLQLSPLFVARTCAVDERPPAKRRPYGALLVGLVLAGIVVASFAAWRTQRNDRRRSAQRRLGDHSLGPWPPGV